VILGLDTSGDELLVALIENGRSLTGEVHPGPRHQDRVIEVIARVAGPQLAGIDAVAVARGPGSHTGLRVGLSVAAGIAFGRHLGIYPLSSLVVAAQRALGPGRVLALVAAGRGRAYTQEFTSQGASRSPVGARRLETIGEIDVGGRSLGGEPALLARLSADGRGGVRGGAEALAAAVSQAVGASEVVNYDQLKGDYGDW